MSQLTWKVSADGTGKYAYFGEFSSSFVGQYVKALNRNGYEALRVTNVKGSALRQDQTMFFLTIDEAEAWIEEPIAIRRLRGELKS